MTRDPYDLETGPWTCPTCGEELPTWTEYQRHREQHEDERP